MSSEERAGLSSPALARTWREARRARERRGRDGDALVSLRSLEREEAAALDALPWPGRQRPILAGGDLRVRLSRLEEAVRAAGGDPATLLAGDGGPVRDLPAERREERSRRAAFWSWLASHPAVALRPALGAWVERAQTAGRPGPDDRELVERALRIVTALPWPETVDRAVLAALLADGDPHALDDREPLGILVEELLRTLEGDPTLERRAVWQRARVEVDPLSVTVLAAGLRPEGSGPTVEMLASLNGSHAVITLAQLRDSELGWPGVGEAFVCENPVVVRAAERELGSGCPPLICTGGWPNGAVVALLESLAAAGATLRHHGDFDPEGVAIHQHLRERVPVVAWRFDAPSYLRGLADAPGPLPRMGEPRRLGHGALADALRARGRMLCEELVLDGLIADLRAAGFR